jgi:hypothetical protein
MISFKKFNFLKNGGMQSSSHLNKPNFNEERVIYITELEECELIFEYRIAKFSLKSLLRNAIFNFINYFF